jgi:hypothetical protein
LFGGIHSSSPLDLPGMHSGLGRVVQVGKSYARMKDCPHAAMECRRCFFSPCLVRSTNVHFSRSAMSRVTGRREDQLPFIFFGTKAPMRSLVRKPIFHLASIAWLDSCRSHPPRPKPSGSSSRVLAPTRPTNRFVDTVSGRWRDRTVSPPCLHPVASSCSLDRGRYWCGTHTRTVPTHPPQRRALRL